MGKNEQIELYNTGLYAGRNARPIDPDHVELCEQWLRMFCCVKRKQINTRYSSYTLKDFVRNWSGQYVSNGAFIQAAINQGFGWQPVKGGGISAYFNISLPRKGSQAWDMTGIG